VSFHPTGDYLLSSTDHTGIRLWDIEAKKAYLNPKTEVNHFGAVNMVKFSADGKMYASCSADGSIKFWDGVSHECVNTLTNAHGSLEVFSVQFSKNKKYLLTCGKDCTVRIWDIASGGRQLKKIYCGNPKTNQQSWEHRIPACFTYNEEFVITTDEATNSCVAWDTRTGDLVQKLVGHNQSVRGLAGSPTRPHLISCSDDHKVRLWVEESAEQQQQPTHG
jgi:cleavage stimulation factor subunit 1